MAQFVWGLVIGEWWVNPPKKRYKHIHVRLGSAIHGSAHSWKALSDRPSEFIRAFFNPLLLLSSVLVEFSHDFLAETVDFAFSGERDKGHFSRLAGFEADGGAGGDV